MQSLYIIMNQYAVVRPAIALSDNDKDNDNILFDHNIQIYTTDLHQFINQNMNQVERLLFKKKAILVYSMFTFASVTSKLIKILAKILIIV